VFNRSAPYKSYIKILDLQFTLTQQPERDLVAYVDAEILTGNIIFGMETRQ